MRHFMCDKEFHVHRVSKNVAALASYNFDTRERIFIFLDRNATDKVSNQKTLYYATSNNLCFCTTWQNGNTKITFFTRCISALPEFNQSLLDFFSLFDSRLILTLLYDSLNLVINAFWGRGSRKRKSIALQQLDCVACIRQQCAVFWFSSFARQC